MDPRETRGIGSLFSGIGGLELGLEWAGLGPVAWQVEIDRELREDVLARWWPHADRSVSDVREAGRDLGPVRLVCGGFPCQDVSVAGLGRGLDGERSGLWREFARVVGELLPRWVVVENVASGKARWLCQVRSDLQALGYRSSAVALSAADVGAPHRRARIFVVANRDSHGCEGVAPRRTVAGVALRDHADGCGPVAYTHGGELRDAEQRDPGDGRERYETAGAPSLETIARSEGGALDPGWVEALMGFPRGWTAGLRGAALRKLRTSPLALFATDAGEHDASGSPRWVTRSSLSARRSSDG